METLETSSFFLQKLCLFQEDYMPFFFSFFMQFFFSLFCYVCEQFIQ